MNLRIAYALSLLLLILSIPGVCGENPGNKLQQDLNKIFIKKIFIIRGFYSGTSLAYDPEGKLISVRKREPWTLNGYFEPSEIKLSEKEIILSGKRIYWSYNQVEGKSHLTRSGEITIITIGRSPEQQSLPLLLKSLHKVFLTGTESLVDSARPYWKKIILAGFDIKKTIQWNRTVLSKQDSTITKPVLLSNNPQPDYTEQAKQAHCEGGGILHVLITKEGNVKVQDIVVPMGLGLDENAIAACEKWKFKPALRNGKPVDMLSTIDFSFKIY
jgi:TonB family protein